MAISGGERKRRDTQRESSGLQCICLSQSNTSDLPLISKAAAVAMTDRTSSKISQCGSNGLKCIRLSQPNTSDGPSSSKAAAVNRTHKTISKISQNDFIVNNLLFGQICNYVNPHCGSDKRNSWQLKACTFYSKISNSENL